jgi:hypothetical protein
MWRDFSKATGRVQRLPGAQFAKLQVRCLDESVACVHEGLRGSVICV